MSFVENSTENYYLAIVELYEEFTKQEQYLGVAIICPVRANCKRSLKYKNQLQIGICGLIASIWALRIIWKSDVLHNCFGYLLFLHASANALVLFIFVFWAVPLTVLQVQKMFKKCCKNQFFTSNLKFSHHPL